MTRIKLRYDNINKKTTILTIIELQKKFSSKPVIVKINFFQTAKKLCVCQIFSLYPINHRLETNCITHTSNKARKFCARDKHKN